MATRSIQRFEDDRNVIPIVSKDNIGTHGLTGNEKNSFDFLSPVVDLGYSYSNLMPDSSPRNHRF